MKAKLMLVVLLAVGAAVVLAATPDTATRARPDEAAPASSVSDPLSDYARHVRIASAVSHANLALFPVSVSDVRVPHVDLPLDKAMAAGLIEVTELGRSEVSQLRVRNGAKEPVFVMAGEMLRGGKQDRIAGDDLIVPARKELTIPVFCVERGRWAGRAAGFTAGHSLAGAGVRGAARGGGKGGVWSSVAEQQRRLGAPSATGALRSVHDSAEVRERMKSYLRALSDMPQDHPTASGVVVAINGRIVVADLFSSRQLFRELWPQLLEAYVIDALEREERPHSSGGTRHKETAPDAGDVQSWVEELASATRKPRKTPGSGDLFELGGRSVVGSCLVYDGGIVHIGLFRTHAVGRTDYNRLEFRRGRLGERQRPLRAR